MIREAYSLISSVSPLGTSAAPMICAARRDPTSVKTHALHVPLFKPADPFPL